MGIRGYGLQEQIANREGNWVKGKREKDLEFEAFDEQADGGK